MIKACIFDLDGTLIDTLGDIAHATNYGLEKLGYPTHPIEPYKKFVGDGIYKLAQKSLPREIRENEKTVLKLLEYYNEHYNENYAKTTLPYPSVVKCLETLEEMGMKIGILTNKPDVFVKPLIEKLFPNIKFDIAIGNSDKFPPKPDKKITNYVLETLSVKPCESIYIGDSDVDVYTGKNANIENIIGVSWGFRGREELKEAGAKYIIDDAMEIIDIVKEINLK